MYVIFKWFSYRFWLFVMFVISLTLATYAPNVDKDMTIHYYVRSREQDEQLGLLEVCNTTVMLLTWLDPLHPMGGTARARCYSGFPFPSVFCDKFCFSTVFANFFLRSDVSTLQRVFVKIQLIFIHLPVVFPCHVD